MASLSRRGFISTSLAVGSSLLMTRGVRGANDDIRVAVIGVRQQGNGHIARYRAMSGVRIVALCDVDQAVLAERARAFEERGERVATYTDMRQMLEREELDAVSIASPNHWHTLQAIWALQAGKDVYVEKPLSHNIWEGRKLIEATEKYGRIVQHGTQGRSGIGIAEAIRYIQEGRLGRIRVARGLCYKRRDSIGKVTGPQPIPDSVDYDLWCGPAAKEPLMRQQLHYDWHWVWATGNGDIGNQGVHEMDMALWALGETKLPKRVISLGGRFGYDDDGQTANTQVTLFDFDTAPLIFEVRGLPRSAGTNTSDDYRGVRVGLVVHCENGYFAGGGGGGWFYDNDGNRLEQFAEDGRGNHQAHFIEAVRSRRQQDIKADVHIGHRSSALCHLANISYRVARAAPSPLIVNRLHLHEALSESFGRMAAHLGANGLNLAETPIGLGEWLDIDPETEQITNHEAARALLRGTYRQPFVVPEEV